MRYLFVVNARSGPRRRIDIASLIRSDCEKASVDYELIACASKDELDDIIVRAVEQKHDVVYAVGGDGTVHEVAKRLIGKPLTLGILPTGSGNGLARHLGIPLALEISLAASRSGRIESIDTAEVNGMPFLAVMGVGFDALIAHRFGGSAVRGLRTYVKEGLSAFRGYEPDTYDIEIDGRVLTQRAWIVAVANSSQYGSDARIAPVASLQDGLLDVVIIGEVPIIAAPSLLIRLFNGSIHRSPHATVLQGKRIHIRPSGDESPAHLDGEPVILPTDLHVRVRPKSLKVLIPESGRRI